MCGIFAYLNYCVPRDRKFIVDTLLNGLKRLEYRGYDSAGALATSMSTGWCGRLGMKHDRCHTSLP